jgi:hypothetical protein
LIPEDPLPPPTPSPFQMQGARDAVAGGLEHIERYVVALEDSIADNPGLAFDLAKVLVESLCRTILTDCGHGYSDSWELPKLLKETTDRLQLVPHDLPRAAELAAPLKKTLGGLQTTIQGLCELRNTHGFASHGKPAFAPELESVQALLVARAADAIVHFLFEAHRQYGILRPHLVFGDHPAFDSYIDEVHGRVSIFGVEYRSSELLFSIDRDAYRDQLAKFAPTPNSESPPETALEETGGV